MAEANADAVRLVRPFVEKAIAAAISSALTNALTADNGEIKLAIANAISEHADKTTGVHGLT